MDKIKHVKIVARDDDPRYKADGYDSLFGFAQDLLNETMEGLMAVDGVANVIPISVNESFYADEMRPVMCNSGTWYTRRSLVLSVWYREVLV